MFTREKLKRIKRLRELLSIPASEDDKSKWNDELKELKDGLIPLIYKLPPHQARVMYLRYIDGRSRQQIAYEIFHTSKDYNSTPKSYYESKIDSTLNKATNMLEKMEQ